MATFTEINPDAVLILGAYGMLGSDISRVFPGAHLRGHDLDITDEVSVRAEIGGLRPSLVINAAAYTDVDGCEDQKDIAFAVNGEGPGYIASACHETGARLIHYSTDYVFDGTQPDYIESDTPNPINQYGASKLLGEQRIAACTDDYLIIRTSWLFGKHGKNFVDTILGLARQMDHVRVVDDQFGKPTYTRDLAKKTCEIAGGAPGIYHITNDGVCSWYEFAAAFIDTAVPCSTADFPRKARRPKYSVLNNTKTTPLRSWRDAVADYLSGDLQ